MAARPKPPAEDIAAPSGASAETLTVAEVARLLRCSRPHVAMLVDAGCLSVAIGEGRNVRIALASALAYKKAQMQPRDANYKAAARSAGMYAIPDTGYVEELARKRATKLGKR